MKKKLIVYRVLYEIIIFALVAVLFYRVNVGKTGNTYLFKNLTAYYYGNTALIIFLIFHFINMLLFFIAIGKEKTVAEVNIKALVFGSNGKLRRISLFLFGLFLASLLCVGSIPAAISATDTLSSDLSYKCNSLIGYKIISQNYDVTTDYLHSFVFLNKSAVSFETTLLQTDASYDRNIVLYVQMAENCRPEILENEYNSNLKMLSFEDTQDQHSYETGEINGIKYAVKQNAFGAVITLLKNDRYLSISFNDEQHLIDIDMLVSYCMNLLIE